MTQFRALEKKNTEKFVKGREIRFYNGEKRNGGKAKSLGAQFLIYIQGEAWIKKKEAGPLNQLTANG